MKTKKEIGECLRTLRGERNGIRITTSEAYVTVRKGSSGLASPTIHALDLAFINETTHLQLTSNGKPVGAGVEIPTTETTVWKTADWLAGNHSGGTAARASHRRRIRL